MKTRQLLTWTVTVTDMFGVYISTAVVQARDLAAAVRPIQKIYPAPLYKCSGLIYQSGDIIFFDQFQKLDISKFRVK